MKKILIIAALFFSNIALAHESGPYVVGGVSAAHSEYYDGEGYNHYGASVGGGYQFNAYLASEVAFVYEKADYADDGVLGVSFSVLPMVPITTSVDGFLALNYVVVDSNDWDDIDDEFRVHIGLLKHFSNDMFIRAKVGTSLESGVDAIGVGFDIGMAF